MHTQTKSRNGRKNGNTGGMEKQEKKNTKEVFRKKGTKDMRRIIDEMRAGYNNSQELIRFMDTKLAFISGLCGAIAVGCKGSCMHFYHFFNEPLSINSILRLFVVILFILFSAATFWETLSGIWGRKEGKTTTPAPHILFPIGNSPSFSDFKKQIDSRTEDNEYNEVCFQLYSVGRILEKKMNKSRDAFILFVVQLLLAITLSVFNTVS